MNLPEIVIKDEQRDGGFQVFPFAAESARQAGHSAHFRSDRQVDPFHVRRANAVALGISVPALDNGSLQFSRTIAGRAVRASVVNLDKLTVIHPRSETQTDRLWIGVKAVRGQLESARGGLIEFFNKEFGVLAAPASKMPGQDQFAIPFKREERVGIALPFVLRVPFIAFFAINEGPKLIGLNVRDRHFADALLQELLALLTRDTQDPQHGCDMHIGQSGRGSDGATFGQTIQDPKEFFVGQINGLTRFISSGRKGFAAGSAAIAGSAVFSVIPVRFWAINFAGRTFHGVPMSFLTEQTVRTTIGLAGLFGVYGVSQVMSKGSASNTPFCSHVVPVTRLERVAYSLAGNRSIHLSYTGISMKAGPFPALPDSKTLRNQRDQRTRNLLGLSNAGVSQPIPPSPTRSHRNYITVIRQPVQRVVDAWDRRTGFSHSVQDLATRNGVVRPKVALTVNQQQRSVRHRLGAHGQRNNSSFGPHNLVQAQLATAGRRVLFRCDGHCLFDRGGHIANEISKGFKLGLNYIYRPLSLKLVIPNFHFEPIFSHFAPLSLR